MKLQFFTILFLGIFMLSSCEKIIDVRNIRIPTSTEISLPLAGKEGTEIESLPDFDLKIEIENLDKLQVAELGSLRIKKKNADVLPSLKIIKDADIYLSSKDFPSQKIAFVRNNNNTNEINFDIIKDNDLAKFIKSENKKLSLRNIVIGETSTSTTNIPLVMDLEWKVTIGL